MSSNLSRLLLLKLFLWAHTIVLFNEGLCHFKECFINSLSGFSTCFQNLKVVALFELSDVFICYFDFSFLIIFVIIFVWLFCLLFKITFIGQHNHTYISATILFDFVQPRIYINEGVTIRKIKDNKNTICPFIICFGNSLIPFLPSCVPYLQPHGALIDLKGSESEVYTDGGDIVFFKVIILYKIKVTIKSTTNLSSIFTYCKSHKQTWLANARVSDQDKFEKVIVVSFHWCIFLNLINL